MQNDAMIDISSLSVTFRRGGKTVKAVSGVSLSVKPGEVVALLGESGSGKSVTMRSLLRLHPRGTLIEGGMTIDGRDVLGLSNRALADLRGAVVSMVFQEPRLALDPVYTVGRQIEETIMRHEKVSRSVAAARALALFQKVRIPSPERRLANYPHEMSGGMLQRAMIAMALACNPKVLLADEPTTALDATVQIQILLLIRELQREYGLSVIFVTHDIGVAAEVADRVAVMYAGRIVEEGLVGDIIRNPRHPYTKGLLGARVELADGRDRLITIPGAPPDLAAMPPGCAFAPRCTQVKDLCRTQVPPLAPLSGRAGVACLFPN
ncbi:ABC transporter ATP-binding protein (plasmid) [Agrobacterium radiobacter]|uniref:Oligopeptide ABC transporter (ATP-binding protein) n=1 Tax=Agrobacterium tumefaciens str. B6 TaxID=1183423 RepID=A0A822VC85_AGRTU|nr:ABC transporter ATP-binding protein [Agrobacterium tumefaciens]KWT85115.1 peptide ABC transporter ATP-binding protein [Agrobacterium tumefaciens str. B6]MQB27750.1 ABC transporter ATP-binding protein [Agrobacterium tumefaciens]NTA08579.1 ABC transporter ATP-binding protein [Agrobacterium tumefaciens]NTA94759.1 ABC transporter ATP-binding protein [Agrobacterium tumefaciens]NTB16066.1 ABC transporter ATP-binding protein [Agrobacterium tumefaciens]